ncbi:hypothetical protein NHU_00601 [Rhodovulum sulfidophilum]|uniref:Uncharacterized protein n=1 Tax=Rhodovulum sulfidophilum TaxID=35806 RepID=A0A0D6AYS7_RHOSU|nr:hypothetical protein NHU_00601 [Rhodovulum sulfidophilum]
MAQGVKNVMEPEVSEIMGNIASKHDFLLSGGAGSGKTYSLVRTIEEVCGVYPGSPIACMTYTNATAREILERIAAPNLKVGTIHDFLWDIIKPFQESIKEALITLHNDVEFGGVKFSGSKVSLSDFSEKNIQYKEFYSARRGVISHDELLHISEFLFSRYPKLCSVAKARYPFIFIDEYQDTAPEVVGILLDHFQNSAVESVIGFFGDSMQSIYDGSVGSLTDYVASGRICEVVKTENRRCPSAVIDVANKIRKDNFVRAPSNDPKAPNMENGVVIKGSAKFMYTQGVQDEAFSINDFLGWDFSDIRNCRELNLTHNLIAPRAGFSGLLDIYDKDRVLSYRDRIKSYIKDNAVTTDFSEMTFGQVVDELYSAEGNKKKIDPTKKQREFIDSNIDLFEFAKGLPFLEFSRSYVSKDQLLDDKKEHEGEEGKTNTSRDALIKHLFKIKKIVRLYNNGEVSRFLRLTDIKINRLQDKVDIEENIAKLGKMGGSSIGEVLSFRDKSGIVRIDDNLKFFQENNRYLYHRVQAAPYAWFLSLFEYLEGRSPFSTQHKVKGRQFERVLVVLDNGDWSLYNFENLLSGDGKDTVIARTEKIFYVCCTRAMKDLVVFIKDPSESAISGAKQIFGEEHVINVGTPA